MSGSVKSIWGWSVRNSPIVLVWRSLRTLVRPNREAFVLIERSSLPKPVDAIIRDTIKRTRLWRDEREQVARELIAHANDAIEAGRLPEQVVETFGEPKRVAKLLRRAMKRKRPLGWQLYRFTRRAAAVMVVLLIVGYGWLALRFYTSKPEIKVDYGAVLAQRNEGYSEDQKSWPILAECGFEWFKLSQRLSNTNQEGMWLFPNVPFDHPDYSGIEEELRAFAPRLDLVREAGSRPIVGIPVGYEKTSVEWNDWQMTTGIIPAQPGEFQDHSVIDIELPNLTYARALSIALMFDSRMAIREGDTERAVKNYNAAMGFARQLRREPFIISNLVGTAIHLLVIRQIESVVQEHPGAFGNEHLLELAHVHASLIAMPTVSLELERLGFVDLMQRAFTDNGNGGGHLTPAGFEIFKGFFATPEDFTISRTHPAVELDERVQAAALPLNLVLSNSREREGELYNTVMDQAQSVLDRGPAHISIVDDQAIIDEVVRSGASSYRYSFAAVLTPALESFVNRWFEYQQTSSAFSLLLAVESYRIEHGYLPTDLETLAPSLVPSVSEDLMNPGHEIKYRVFDDRYILYSVGADGNDDNGVGFGPLDFTHPEAANTKSFRARFPGPSVSSELDGDWILIDTRPAQPDPEDS
jgi:hypothetical protein